MCEQEKTLASQNATIKRLEAKLDASLTEQVTLHEQVAQHRATLDDLRSVPEMMRSLVSGLRQQLAESQASQADATRKEIANEFGRMRAALLLTSHHGSPAASQPLGSQPLGSQPLGSQPLGSQPLGSQPLGSQPLGSQPLGSSTGNARLSQCSASCGAPSPVSSSMSHVHPSLEVSPPEAPIRSAPASAHTSGRSVATHVRKRQLQLVREHPAAEALHNPPCYQHHHAQHVPKHMLSAQPPQPQPPQQQHPYQQQHWHRPSSDVSRDDEQGDDNDGCDDDSGSEEAEEMDLFGDGDDGSGGGSDHVVPSALQPARPSSAAPAMLRPVIAPPFSRTHSPPNANVPKSSPPSSTASSHYTPFSVDLSREPPHTAAGSGGDLAPLTLFGGPPPGRRMAPTEGESRSYHVDGAARQHTLQAMGVE